MALPNQVRLGLLTGSVVCITVVATIASSGAKPAAYAQAEATATMLAARTPVPAVSAAATPAVATDAAPPAEPAAAPAAGNSMTASLGGSDIAVSSEGGSYEVDGPKRKAKKVLKLTPTP